MMAFEEMRKFGADNVLEASHRQFVTSMSEYVGNILLDKVALFDLTQLSDTPLPPTDMRVPAAREWWQYCQAYVSDMSNYLKTTENPMRGERTRFIDDVGVHTRIKASIDDGDPSTIGISALLDTLRSDLADEEKIIADPFVLQDYGAAVIFDRIGQLKMDTVDGSTYTRVLSSIPDFMRYSRFEDETSSLDIEPGRLKLKIEPGNDDMIDHHFYFELNPEYNIEAPAFDAGLHLGTSRELKEVFILNSAEVDEPPLRAPDIYALTELVATN